MNNIQAVLFLIGGLLMVIGSGSFVFMFMKHIACWVFLLGTILFSVLQSMQTYQGQNKVIVRLKRILNLSNLLFVFSGILMVDAQYHFLMSLFQHGSDNGYVLYFTYVYNKWVLLLLVAAVLEVYAVNRIDRELKKEKA